MKESTRGNSNHEKNFKNHNDQCDIYKSVQEILAQIKLPDRAVVTSGMPYSNGDLHLGHLAGAFLPADIYARWLKIMMGSDNVLFVCGSDDHGVNSKLSALKKNIKLSDFIQNINANQTKTLKSYAIDLDIYSATSDTDHLFDHSQICNNILLAMKENGYLSVESTYQWYDAKHDQFLPDRFVTGTCPHCGYNQAYGMDCDKCLGTYSPRDLINPVSSISNTTPILKQTNHLWFNFYELAPKILKYLQNNKTNLHKSVYKDLLKDVAPALIIKKSKIDLYKSNSDKIAKHKKKHSKSGDLILEFEDYNQLRLATNQCKKLSLDFSIKKTWASRCISRDTAWGVKLSDEFLSLGFSKQELQQKKSLYVWPESLIAPISFTKRAMIDKKSQNQVSYLDYWCDKNSACYQFIGIDNVYFYGIFQNAMWMAASDKSPTLNLCDEKSKIYLQDKANKANKANKVNKLNKLNKTVKSTNLIPNQIFSRFHLLVDGEKMSKSRKNFILADELLDEYSCDQIRYYLSMMSLREKPGSFEKKLLDNKVSFLAKTLNATFEKPISASLSKFNAQVPEGNLLTKAHDQTLVIIKKYVQFMPSARYSQFLLSLENYARIINTFFNIYKPHDDRYPIADRKDALFSCFFILKNILILLYPFVPETMQKLRYSLNLEKAHIYDKSNLATGFKPNHKINKMCEYFAKTDKDKNKDNDDKDASKD